MTSNDALYLKTLLLYYEEEIMGEAYFYGLAEHFDAAAEREKLALAKVERRAADVVRPLVDKYGLVPRDASVLKALGEASIGDHRHFGWRELMTYITTNFPAFLDEFDALEKMAPEDDLPVLKQLTYHEVVAIDFAHTEIAGDPDSVAPLRRYLGHGAA